jgi:DNA-binding NarL/FixJ family response regulator
VGLLGRGEPGLEDVLTMSPEPPTTVTIIDDQPIPRSGLEHLIAGLDDVVLLASVPAIEDLDPAFCIEDRDPAFCDVVLLHLPDDGEGLTAKAITQAARVGRPVVMASWQRPPGPVDALRAGARGCIVRHSTLETVADAVRVVASGGIYVCRDLAERLHTDLSRPADIDPLGLAPREAETLQWIARGLTHAEIAHRMGLTTSTVNTYAKRIRGKLNVTNRSELTRIAIELGQSTLQPRPVA